MSKVSPYHAVERLLAHLKHSGLIECLELSDEDIADTIWLALQMGVGETIIENQQPLPQEETSKVIIEDGEITKVESTPEASSTTNIYSQDSITQEEPEKKTGSESLPFQTPGAAALQNKLPISRALRPLMRKVPSAIKTIVDVEATVTRIAEGNIWLPITKPEPERWLSLELVVEESRSSFIWAETIDELQKLLQVHGAFRTVRAWNLSSTDNGQLQLTRRRQGSQKSHYQHGYRELISSNRRALILLVSDCVSTIWQHAKIHQWLQEWSNKAPTAIIQLFPERLWQSTELGLGYKLQLSAFNPGVPNSNLILPSLWEELKGKQILKLPVITLEAFSLKNWAKVIAGRENTRTPGFVFDVNFVAEQVKKTVTEKPQEFSPENLVDRFLATASPTAQRLAGLMAAAPVNLPVVNLIQKTFLPNKSTPVNVAEVFLSGMIQRTNTSDNDENPQYDFVPEVRKLLNQATRLGETENVLDIVSSYITQNLGLSIKSFSALLLRYQDFSQEQSEQMLPFARVTVEVLKNLGGKYADFAEQVAGNILVSPLPDSESKLDQKSPRSDLYTLLIGIDCYLPNRLSDGSYYKSLRGCVRDIHDLEAYFVNTIKVPKTNIFKLTASNVDGSDKPKESPEQLPTYKNMVAKFQEITDVAQKGDLVYIHYSGYGGRAKTHFPELKGNLGVDKTLVPTDIGTLNARYLRDVELAYIFKTMVDKGLLLTVVLDSCHSGDATRGVDSDVRGLSVIDTTTRSTESLVATSKELIAAWNVNNNTNRNVTANGWPGEPSGYILLAACRDNEFAHEYRFNGKESNGALTYWLLDSLKKLGTQVTYKTLHDRLLAKIHSQFEQQTPMLQGDSNRLIFSSQSVPDQLTAPVLKIDLAKNQVLLQIGEAYGVRNGAEFAVYSLGTTDFSQTDKRVALVKITELYTVEFWAEIQKMLSTNKIEDIELGANALLLHESVKLVRKVALLPNREALAEIERIKPILEGNNLIEFVSGSEINSGDKDIAYQVLSNEKEYEILKAGKPITNIQPILKAGSNSTITLIKRLIHLCKYQAILQLYNNDPMSSLAGKIKIELCKAGENRQLVPFDEPGNVPTLNNNSTAYLNIRNSSSQTLNITVLVAQPDWSITKLHPKDADFEILEAGQETPIRFSTNLLDGDIQSTYVFKVFATVGATNFDWLKLPALDEPVENPRLRPKNPLEDLFATISSENPPRNLSAVAYASHEWTTEQVELVVKAKEIADERAEAESNANLRDADLSDAN